MKPFFLPILLIIFAAKKVNEAVPTIANDIGSVDRELIGEILNPIIELKKTITGGAVNEKI
tara:strand:+ start:620 stop:802 length:183 start_codon:yes stop_codon:yes gene_type:complete